MQRNNSLILSNNNGLPLVIGQPQEGNHNDLYNINKIFDEMIEILEQTRVSLDGVFMNADAGFDSTDFKKTVNQRD